MKKIVNPWRGLAGYRCYGCDPDNREGLRMEFFEEGETVVSRWTPRHELEGWVDTLHGGVQATLCDEISSWVVFRKFQTSGMTTRMEVRYRRPIRISDGAVTLTARVAEHRSRLVRIAVTIADAAGEVATEAECTYYLFPREVAEREFHFHDCTVEEEAPDGEPVP